MLARTQLNLPFNDPLEPRILPADGSVWFTLNHAVPRSGPDGAVAGGRMVQRPYRLRDFDAVMRLCSVKTCGVRPIDYYLSQGFFAAPCRLAVHLAWATHAYVDLDTYKGDEALRGLSPGDMVRELCWHCRDEDIPAPSIILSSGRGYYAKWFWSRPVPRAEVGRAIAINRALVRRLTRFRADPQAVDMARILRIPGSINAKTGGMVAIVWISESDGGPITYDFDTFARDILPLPVDASPDGLLQDGPSRLWRKTLPDACPGLFNREAWHWGVLEDLRTLAALRYSGGMVEPGMRDLFGHLAACQLARVVPVHVLYREIVAILRTLLPVGYIDRELHGHSATLLHRARRAAEGKLVTFRDGHRTPIYTYRKARMMDMMAITPAEERLMTRLISQTEKRRRETERRRTNGTIERKTWLAENAVSRERPWEAGGISRATWHRRRVAAS
jgi:hypothetical protein